MTSNVTQQDGKAAGGMIGAQDEGNKRSVVVTLGASDEGTVVNVVVTEKK